MPILDDAAADKLLAAIFTPASADLPTEYVIELWDDDPTLEGAAKLTGGGYADSDPVAVDTDWSAPAGRMTSCSPVFPSPTGEWPVATHYVCRGDDDLGYTYGELAEELEVTGAGDPPTVIVTVFFEDPDPED